MTKPAREDGPSRERQLVDRTTSEPSPWEADSSRSDKRASQLGVFLGNLTSAHASSRHLRCLSRYLQYPR